MPLSPDTLDRAFATIERAAVAGERCPVTAREGTAGLPPGATTALAKASRIRVEVYAKNYRVVQILTGQHAGKRTMEPPSPGWQPYRIVDHKGATQLRTARLGAPSAPRPLRANEL